VSNGSTFKRVVDAISGPCQMIGFIGLVPLIASTLMPPVEEAMLSVGLACIAVSLAPLPVELLLFFLRRRSEKT
jgi:hypothetical protein